MSARVSVIIPTHNRRDFLLKLLDSLWQQNLPAQAYEVIVVCDGVTDGTNIALRNLCGAHPNLRVIEQQNAGPAVARNAGARVAQGTYLAFTDDDCIAEPDWLSHLIPPFDDPEVVAVEGRTTTIVSERTPLTHQIESNGNLGVMPTCNAACRRETFARLGGFAEGFPFPHNEDADLAWRLETLGRIHYAADAVIVHPPRPEGFFKKVAWVSYLESEFMLFSRNPSAYRKHRSSSPWITIYWKIFVVGQIYSLRSALKQLLIRFSPRYFFIITGLVFAQWWRLLRLYPTFRRAARSVS